jgi:8-amino-7-oxononanoate synthase
MLINHAKTVICSIAPGFTLLAAARAGYTLLKSDAAQQARDRVQYLVKFFLETLDANPIWEQANAANIARIPLYEEEDWNARPFVSHICPVWTSKPKHNIYLSFHLQTAGFACYPVVFPIVPKGQERVRVIFHAANTEEEILKLAESICSWAEEMLDIEDAGERGKLPSAARHAFSLLAKEGMNGSS